MRILRVAIFVCEVALTAWCHTLDVVSIKPAQGGKKASGIGYDPVMLTMRGVPLRAIVAAAYGVADYQVAGPVWQADEDAAAKLDKGKAKPRPQQDRRSIFTAIREQPGLRLSPGKAQAELLVIDRVERAPTAN